MDPGVLMNEDSVKENFGSGDRPSLVYLSVSTHETNYSVASRIVVDSQCTHLVELQGESTRRSKTVGND